MEQLPSDEPANPDGLSQQFHLFTLSPQPSPRGAATPPPALPPSPPLNSAGGSARSRQTPRPPLRTLPASCSPASLPPPPPKGRQRAGANGPGVSTDTHRHRRSCLPGPGPGAACAASPATSGPGTAPLGRAGAAARPRSLRPSEL